MPQATQRERGDVGGEFFEVARGEHFFGLQAVDHLAAALVEQALACDAETAVADGFARGFGAEKGFYDLGELFFQR